MLSPCYQDARKNIYMSYGLADGTISHRIETELFVCHFLSNSSMQPELRLAHLCGERANL